MCLNYWSQNLYQYLGEVILIVQKLAFNLQ